MMLFEILKGTPLWVWPVSVYGISIGIKGLQDRPIHIYKSVILSFLFLYLGISSLFASMHYYPVLGLVWLGFVSLSIVFSYCYLTPEPTIKGTILMAKGSPVYLILFPVIFLTKFVYGVLSAMNPEILHSLIFLFPFYIVKSICTGIMIGKTARYLHCLLMNRQQMTH